MNALIFYTTPTDLDDNETEALQQKPARTHMSRYSEEEVKVLGSIKTSACWIPVTNETYVERLNKLAYAKT